MARLNRILPLGLLVVALGVTGCRSTKYQTTEYPVGPTPVPAVPAYSDYPGTETPMPMAPRAPYLQQAPAPSGTPSLQPIPAVPGFGAPAEEVPPAPVEPQASSQSETAVRPVGWKPGSWIKGAFTH